ncbi:hypothetical protein I312_102323 [Cryptococcus bacillisporus CA1280]|uniref:uncharacterized protein n=1 Tax=Cryptococcus bacillisporus CA1280 TaxID=1296109 RepID=UPI0033668EEF
MYPTELHCSLFIRLNHYLTLRLPSSPPVRYSHPLPPSYHPLCCVNSAPYPVLRAPRNIQLDLSYRHPSNEAGI